MAILEREIEKKIEEHLKTRNNVLMVIGARQVGKSTSIRKVGEDDSALLEEVAPYEIELA